MTVLPFPGRTHRTKTIRTLDTHHEIATAWFTGGETWSWISNTVAQECECSAEQVAILEDPDRGDVLTVDGLPVFLLC